MSQTTFPLTEQNNRFRAMITARLQQWPIILTAVGLLGLYILLFAFVQFSSPNLFGTDGYFHIKFAQVMRQQGLLPTFSWLPLTILNAEDYFDHHFLYHVLLIPFTFGNLLTGAKWAAIIFPSLAFLMGWIVLRGQRVLYPAIWAVAFFAVSNAFLVRLSMTRVQAASLLVLFLILHVTLKQRYRWLLPLSFVYIWLYDGFMLVLILVGVYVAVRWLFEHRLVLSPLGYTLLGLGLGMVINPYFPHNFVFIYHHILPKLIDTTDFNVGNEWYPYTTWRLVENSGLALLAFVSGTFAIGFSERRMGVRTATLFAIAVIFGLLLFKSRRFVEYFPAFALLFCAAAWTPLLLDWRQRGGWLAKLIPLGLLVVIALGSWRNVQLLREELRDETPYSYYADASAWLKENTPPNSRVFHTDWDDFSRLYFYNTHNSYIIGLDPTYMQSFDADLYQTWRKISNGREEPPSPAIVEHFDTHYVLTDLDHVRFLYVAAADSNMVEVYRDEDAVIFKIVNE